MTVDVKDQTQRLSALDATQSYIVQAPAGSGKTELLTQRFLVLLACAKNAPEEVVAITFTRKAASEMRARILEALSNASTNDAPDQAHAKHTWDLARNVLKRDQVSNWNLLQNPNRLRILTIDALCARIAKSAPLISNFGALPNVVEDALPFYREAAQALLASLNEAELYRSALEKLLLHLDNNYFLAENLFVGMLSRRDQWLSYAINHRNGKDSRALLEMGLQNIISDSLKSTYKYFTDEDKSELLSLICFAADMVKNSEKKTTISNCENLTVFPAPEIDELGSWLGIAQLLLTSSYEWRRAVNKNCGFPPASSAINDEEGYLFKHMKERMLRLLAKFNEHESLRLSLKNILLLPSAHYSDNQWEIVNALTALLPILVAHLNLIFRERNVIDFIAIAEGAIHALGDTENPSEIALNLDYRIQHLLVDEFQDTSITQYRLLELLTAGWEKNDGRTLFLVGDPMQSIYRFREAEVGIFLRVKNYGIGSIKLIPLRLEVNFRSKPGVIDWFNETFVSIFPQNENIELGAIPYSPSYPFVIPANSPSVIPAKAGIQSQDASLRWHDGGGNARCDGGERTCVQMHPFLNPDENTEADYIVNLLQTARINYPEKSIAILVRSRSHLKNIIPALKNANLNFHAVEIEKLIYSNAVQDLFALTKALSHLGDRIAWLGILRAPWCGLSLADLYLIANYEAKSTIWETLTHCQKLGLSDEGIQRLSRIIPILEFALNERSRNTIRAWMTYTWYMLGGPACLEEEHEIQNAEAYFQLLDYFDDSSVLDFNLLEQKLISSYSHSPSSNANIHLMTIHKAKGLEFDIVILPSLEKKPAIDENRLLMWLERQNDQGQTDLILAPIKSLEEEFDPIYRYVRNQNNLKSQYEITRLLYVAATRAKEELHLIGSIYPQRRLGDDESQELRVPLQGSFLQLLWPYVQSSFEKNKITETLPQIENDEDSVRSLERLALDWKLPDVLPAPETTSLTLTNTTFSWTPEYLNHLGTVIHQFLQKICEEKSSNSTQIDFAKEKRLWLKKLLQLGVSETYLDSSLITIENAITKMLNDPRGQWILRSDHVESKNEFSLSVNENNEIKHYIIDRTFIDDQGIRWIIDYKTSELLQEDETFFLVKAKLRYAEQLENYAKVMKLLEDRPIKLGLYFPLFTGWCEWDFKVC